MQFTYRAKQDAKTETSGVIEAADVSAAVGHLKRLGLYPLEVVALDAPHRDSAVAPVISKRPLSRGNLALWSRTIGQALTAGLSLTQALHLLAEQEQGRPLGRTAKILEEQVTAGMSLASAMERLGPTFSAVSVNLVRAGETSGALEQVLQALALQAEQEADLIAKVRGALVYPLFVLAVGMATVAVLIWVVVPKLALLFAETGQPLPLTTRLLIHSGKGILWGFFLGGASLLAGWRMLRRKGGGFSLERRVLHGLGRLPWLRRLASEAQWAQLTSTLSLLLGHGVALPTALHLVSGTVGPSRLRDQIRQAEQEVVEGRGVSAALRQAGIKEPFLLTMVAMGEAQGDLAQAFHQAAARYQQGVDHSVKVLSTLIEPVMILLVGLVVGGVVFSMMLPIFQVNFSLG